MNLTAKDLGHNFQTWYKYHIIIIWSGEVFLNHFGGSEILGRYATLFLVKNINRK